MQVIKLRTVTGAEADALWEMYAESFDVLRTVAAQRHAFDRTEIDDLLRDPRVVKHIARDEARGRPCGLATVTNDLSAVPLVSPDYFASKWPERTASRLVWYVIFLAVHPDYQGTSAISHLIGSLCDVPARTGGVLAADICEFNERTIRLPMAIGRLLGTFAPGVRTTRLDAQVYWAYEFPTPAAAASP